MAAHGQQHRANRVDVFYPIVPDATWLERIVPLGVRTIQLRIKDAADAEIRRQIDRSLACCRRHACQLIVNDYWLQAIEAGADFIHLGQEDLAAADLAAIKQAGLALGVSTHSEAELDRAVAAEPDYIALGPVYETKLKQMQWGPQGLGMVRLWKQRIGTRPLIAIGGITLERAPSVIEAGADAVSVVTDILFNAEPETRVTAWLDWAKTVPS